VQASGGNERAISDSKYHRGTYADSSIGIPLCKENEHVELEERLMTAAARVTESDSNHVQMVVEEQTILIRKRDCFLRESVKHTKLDWKPSSGSWVNLQHGRGLCYSRSWSMHECYMVMMFAWIYQTTIWQISTRCLSQSVEVTDLS